MSEKKENTQMSNIFTINLDQQSDSHEIPGVTSLLNPAKMAAAAAAKEKAAKEKAEAAKKEAFTLEPTQNKAPPTTATPPAMTEKPIQQLKDLGVLFELQFTPRQNSFRFQANVPHGELFLQAWQQELLTDMKLDLKTLSFNDSFKEYRFDIFGFLYCALGVQPQHFIQIVQAPQDSNVVHVLVSNQSQMKNREAILAIIQQSPAEKVAAAELSGVIEIDLTG